MAVKTEAQIKAEIDAHIQKCGGAYGDWYVGITDDTNRRLFQEHKVDKDKDAWIRREASNDTISRRAEDYFVKKGCDGGGGGGDEDSVFVYAYKKKNHTVE